MRENAERVILVDRNDAEIGSAEKLEAHARGVLHRAFSVFVLNSRGELLLQRRAEVKYHSGGLWSNTCCGHPRPGEEVGAAAERRLREEMGFGCDLARRFGFVYEARLEAGLSEHEYDHVFIGRYDGSPTPDPEEVSEWRWASLERVAEELEESPASFTPWFRAAMEGLLREGAVGPAPEAGPGPRRGETRRGV